MRQLEGATGVKQVSLYNAFGNKEELFLAVLDRYSDLILREMDQHMEKRDLNGISAFIESIVSPDATFPNVRYGCLMVSTAQVPDAAGPAAMRRIETCRSRITARIVAALERAKSRGKLRRGLNLDECADFVVTILWGIFASIRLAGGDQTVGMTSSKVLKRTFRDWRAESR